MRVGSYHGAISSEDLDADAFEILEARLILEVGCAGLVVATITDEEVDELESIVEQMELAENLEDFEHLD